MRSARRWLLTLIGLLPAQLAWAASPNLDAGPDQTVEEQQRIPLKAQFSPEDPKAKIRWRQLSGPKARIHPDDQRSIDVFTPVLTEPARLLFEVEILTGGQRLQDQIELQVLPVNRPPLFRLPSEIEVKEQSQLDVRLSVEVYDEDGEVTQFHWQQLDGPALETRQAADGSLSILTPRLTEEARALFRFSALDNEGAERVDIVELRILPVNQPPSLSFAKPLTELEQQPVTLTAQAADADGEIRAWQWEQIAGPALPLGALDGPELQFQAPRLSHTQDYRFRLTVTDDEGARQSAEQTLTLVAVNALPELRLPATLEANEQTQLLLEAKASDADGRIAQYQWEQIEGPALPLVRLNEPSLSLDLPPLTAQTQYGFRLTVTDDEGGAISAQTRVLGLPVNLPPQLEMPNPQEIDEQSELRLSARALDPDGRIQSYRWEQLEGPALTLLTPDAAELLLRTPSLREPALVRLNLQVTDDEGATTVGLTSLTIRPVNQPPRISPLTLDPVPEQSRQQIEAQAEDTDGTLVSYRWRQLDGPLAELLTPNSASLALITPSTLTEVPLTLALQVMDDEGGQSEQTYVLRVLPVNAAPSVRILAPARIAEQSLLVLEAQAEDVDGSIRHYAWTQTAGPQLPLTGVTEPRLQLQTPTLLTPVQLGFALSVTDNEGAQASHEIQVQVDPVNALPHLSLGPDQVRDEQTDFRLEPQASDPDGSLVAYQWRQLSGPPVEFQPDQSSLSLRTPTLVEPAELLFSLSIRDNEGGQAQEQFRLRVEPVNALPWVRLPAQLEVRERDPLILTSEAGDPDGHLVTFDWQQLDGERLRLRETDEPRLRLEAPALEQDGRYRLQLVVTDNEGGQARAEILLKVRHYPLLSQLSFPDPHLQACVDRSAAAKGWRDSGEVETLECQDPIQQLTGIGQLENLNRLSLQTPTGSLNDIRALKDLPRLTQLALYTETLPELQVLAELSQLRSLELYQTPLTDAAFLRQLPALNYLYLSFNQLQQVPDLAAQQGLTQLYLASNRLQDLKPLPRLPALETLFLDNNALTDISPLLHQPKLRYVSLRGNPQLDCSQLATLVQQMGPGAQVLAPVHCR